MEMAWRRPRKIETPWYCGERQRHAPAYLGAGQAMPLETKAGKRCVKAEAPRFDGPVRARPVQTHRPLGEAAHSGGRQQAPASAARCGQGHTPD